MRFLCICALLASGISTELQSSESSPVVFKVVSGEETGLKAIIEKWKADELARQGGKFGDHGWWPWGLSAFDYNNDGAIDLVAQQHGQPLSIVIKSQLKEKGSLTFVNANAELGLPSNGMAGCFKPVPIDIDGDGFIDLIFNDALPNTVFFNKEGKKFEAMGFGLPQLGHTDDVHEVSAEGYPIVGNQHERYVYDPSSRKYKQQAHEDPRLVTPPEALAALMTEMKAKNRFLRIEYFDGIALSKESTALACGGFAAYGGSVFGRYLLADKNGVLSDATEQLGLPKDGCPIFFADLNNDGLDDVLIVGAGLYLSTPEGKYALKPGPVTDFLKNVGPYLSKVFPVDFNADGRIDLVLNNPRRDVVSIFENLGNGDFKQVATQAAWDADPVSVCDINNDGLMDVCVGGPGDTITLYLNQTAKPGHSCMLFPTMDKPNPYGVGTKLEIFKAGELGKSGCRPFQTEWAHSDGLPIYVGLGDATTFDVRATFPGKTPKTLELKNIEAWKKILITPDGKPQEKK